MESIEITKQDLIDALIEWEISYRAGGCISHEEASALSVEEVAKLSAESLWRELCGEE